MENLIGGLVVFVLIALSSLSAFKKKKKENTIDGIPESDGDQVSHRIPEHQEYTTYEVRNDDPYDFQAATDVPKNNSKLEYTPLQYSKMISNSSESKQKHTKYHGDISVDFYADEIRCDTIYDVEPELDRQEKELGHTKNSTIDFDLKKAILYSEIITPKF